MENYKLPKSIIIIIAIACALIFVVVAMYIIQFGGIGNFGDQERFGQLGDYIGGLTNPILTFITVVLLIWSIRIQVGELNASRNELKETRKVHEELLISNKQEVIRKQLQDDSALYINKCEALLDKPVFYIKIYKRGRRE